MDWPNTTLSRDHSLSTSDKHNHAHPCLWKAMTAPDYVSVFLQLRTLNSRMEGSNSNTTLLVTIQQFDLLDNVMLLPEWGKTYLHEDC